MIRLYFEVVDNVPEINEKMSQHAELGGWRNFPEEIRYMIETQDFPSADVH
jgi:hypothetical protein